MGSVRRFPVCTYCTIDLRQVNALRALFLEAVLEASAELLFGCWTVQVAPADSLPYSDFRRSIAFHRMEHSFPVVIV